MSVVRVLLIKRSLALSSIEPEADAKILLAVDAILRRRGYLTIVVSEDDLCANRFSCGDESFNMVFSMSRRPDLLAWLSSEMFANVPIENSPYAVAQCSRGNISRLLNEEVPQKGSKPDVAGVWLKPGNSQGVHAGGVRYYSRYKEAAEQLQQLELDGFDDNVIVPHIEGDVVKYYGVGKCVFFRCYDAEKCPVILPDAIEAQLRDKVKQMVKKTSVHIFGGDAVITQDGDVHIIDFNDWPSYSPCVEEAATSIATFCLDSMFI